MANTTLWLQAKTGDTPPAYTGIMDRKVIGSMYPIEGVLGVGQLKVTQRAAGDNLTVDIAPGGAVVKCDTIVNGGSYLTFEDATVNLSIPAAPSSGSRTHKIYERIVDPQADGSTAGYNASGPFVSQDTGSGAPDVQSAYLLATVTVTHGQASVVNSMITDMRNQASGPAPDEVVGVNEQTSVNGRITVPHDLGSQPSFASLTLDSNNNTYKEYLVSKASDVVTWELRATDTKALAHEGQTITGQMLVRR